MELLRQKECAKSITVYGFNHEHEEVILTIDKAFIPHNSIRLSNYASLNQLTFQFACLTERDYEILKAVCEKRPYWSFTVAMQEIWRSSDTHEDKTIKRVYGPFNRIQLSYDVDNENPVIYTLTLDNN